MKLLGSMAVALRRISIALDVGAPRGGSRQILETRSGSDGAHLVRYQRELVKCGKAKCQRWHGPYWYAYWRAGARVRKKYIGKNFRELVVHQDVNALLDELERKRRP